MSDRRDVAQWCESSMTVSTIVFPNGSRAKCDQNQVELGMSLTRGSYAQHMEGESGE